MKPARQVCALALSLLLFLLGSLTVARGQYSFTDQNSVSSISGQFMVTSTDQDAPFYRDPVLAANTNLVRLKTSLLAVAAERYRAALWQQLGIAPNASWSGRVFLHLHPARSLDETVFIKSDLILNRWNYRVELPDMLSKTRFARAMTGVLLLELANRTPGPDGHGAELPDWLVDGLAQQILATEGDKVVLSAPLIKSGDRELPVNRINRLDRGLDPLARARLIVQTLPVLSFDQLSWPTDAQMDGEDGGAYWASAQLFQAELLGLKNGKDKLRAMLAELPRHYNWQTAFFDAFGHDFHSPLDVEKWWALRMVNFASRAPGPRWTTDVSLARLEELMSVPVEYRSESNALPAHAEISLQDALKNLTAAQRDSILRAKIRDLSLVQLRLAPPFGDLANGYRLVLTECLAQSQETTRTTVVNKHGTLVNHEVDISGTVKKLDELDRRRRDAEAKSVIQLTGSGRP